MRGKKRPLPPPPLILNVPRTQTDSIQEVEFRIEGVMFLYDTRSCAETGRPDGEKINQSHLTLETKADPQPTLHHPTLLSKDDSNKISKMSSRNRLITNRRFQLVSNPVRSVC